MTHRTVLTLVIKTGSLRLPMKAIEELKEWAENRPDVVDFQVVEFHSHLNVDGDTNILDWSLSDDRLGFPTRIINALTQPRRRKREHGWASREYPEDAILTLGNLVARDARTLLEYGSFGKTSLQQVRTILARYGLYLLGESRQPPRDS